MVIHPLRHVEQEHEHIEEQSDAGQIHLDPCADAGILCRKGIGGIQQHEHAAQNGLNHQKHRRREAIEVQEGGHELQQADAPLEQCAKQLGGVFESHKPVTLRPAGALTEAGHKAGGLLVVDAHVVVPQDAPTFAGGLHLQFKVLRKGHGRPAAALMQVFGRYRKARAADDAVDAQTGLGVLEEAVGDGIGHIIEQRDDTLAVLGAQIALDDIRLAIRRQVLAVDLAEHVGVHQIIRVDEHDHIIFFVIPLQSLKRLFQRDGLAGGCVGAVLLADEHLGAHAAGQFRSIVGAVIRQNVKVIHFARIVHVGQVVDQIADDGLLVVSRHQHHKAQLGIVILIILGIFLIAQERYSQLEEQQNHQPGAHDIHNPPEHLRQYFHVQDSLINDCRRMNIRPQTHAGCSAAEFPA